MPTSTCAAHRAHPCSAGTTDAERIKLEKFLQRHPIEGALSRWAAQWNPGKDSPPPPSTEKNPWPPSSREVRLRGRLLAAHTILMADRGLSPAKISAAFIDQGLKRPIREDLSKPLVDAHLVGGILASWGSSRGIGLSVNQRLRHAAACRVFASPEEQPSPEELQPELQRRFAELVNGGCNEPGRVDNVPPQEPAEESQPRPTTPQAPVSSAQGDDRRTEGDEVKSTDDKVREILRDRPRAKSPRIAKDLKLSDKTVRKTPSWRENRTRLEQRKAERADALHHATSLTAKREAVISSQSADDVANGQRWNGRPCPPSSASDDPAVIAEAREEEAPNEFDLLERRYLEQASPADKRAYFTMKQLGEHGAYLDAFKLTGIT
jgi:hypothetical protein